MITSWLPKNLSAINSRTLTSVVRLFSSELNKNSSDIDWHTVVCDSGVVACWHPTKPFPYEFSKPIDLNDYVKDKKRIEQARKTLKNRLTSAKPYGRPGPKNIELTEIFYTNKQEWKTRNREDKLYATSFPIPKRKF